MLCSFRRVICGIAMLALASNAHGALIERFETGGVGLPVAIPDDGYAGDVTSPTQAASSVIAVDFVEPNPVIKSVHLVETMITHSWAGDLVIKLMSPEGTVVTLLNRPALGAPDDGTGGGGSAANLAGGTTIFFDDNASDSAETMGATLQFFETVGQGGNPDTYAPDADTAAPGNLASFAGENPDGDWTLFVGDGFLFETGQLEDWAITIEIVPEPAALSLLLPGAMMLTRRNRRR